jgi:hypothetical protein
MNELSILSNQLGGLSPVSKWAIKREGNALVSKTMLSTLHEQGRAHLTSTALENVGNLSALAEHLTSIAPSGERRYHAIVDAYALGAASKIARW